MIDSAFQNLRFATFDIAIEALEKLTLPEYKGSTFRGGFGAEFKKVVCVNPAETNCNCCMLRSHCPYFQIFETKADEAARRSLKISDDAPRPFVLEPPITSQREFRPGERLTFRLIVIGKYTEYLPYFVFVFDEVGQRRGLGRWSPEGRGKFKLLSVSSGGKRIYSGETKAFDGHFEVQTVETIFCNHASHNSQRLRLKFITPTRIEVDHKTRMLRDPGDFKTFIIPLYRRLSLLQSLYCSQYLEPYSHREVETLARGVRLVHSDLRWFDWERYSNRQKQRMTFGGFLGEVTFEGDLTPFLPMILLGEYLHVGKYTTFGLGKYEVLVPNQKNGK